MNCRARILFIEGSINPSDATDVLGIEPSQSWVVGDLRTSKISLYTDNGWVYEWKFSSDDFPKNVFLEIDRLFAANKSSVAKFFRDFGGYLQLKFPTDWDGTYLGVEELAALKELNLGLELVFP